MKLFTLCCGLLQLCFATIFAEVVFPEKYDWMDVAIEENFAHYANGISKESIDRSEQGAKRICRIKIIDNRVHLVSGRETAGYTMCQKLAAKYTLPDIDFLYHTHDVVKRFFPGRAPVLCSSKKKSVWQAIPFCEWYQRQGWHRYVKSINKAGINPWDDRPGTLSWRGSPNNSQRMLLVLLGLEHPNLINAKFAAKSKKVKARIDPMHLSERISYTSLMQNKFQIDIDGIGTTYWGLMWKLYSNSLVFQPDSKLTRWCYPALKPGVHFVRTTANHSDLIEKIEYYLEHDDEAQEIAENGRYIAEELFANDNAIEAFCYKTLIKYSSLQTFQPSLD